ncbi:MULTISPECIES: hypothetical protein [Lacticaseibacillus]|uniref:Phage infection protein n=3 Tax=Lacticaseibacillus TaxID=2759736 RepID=A0A5R8LJM9_LACZE|nr:MULTISPECIES: hypothetical protein [Lacticaseibacillus]OFS00487.1 phage infection protein [Lactobacillus sp. HMSC068F07]HAJ55079.1 phage infection protein [Lactobacillus sp.]MBI6597816.1 phage infection protein [Lacticaseibacillus casei]MBO1481528.1 phage infection protein [Lacticaseibacillus casei]MBO2416798.1 phage infection protein [Lacticaseibacillus casei]
MTYEDKIGEQKFAALVDDFFANRYIDRGMRKWQGYYLSDHTAALKKQAKAESVTYPPLSLQEQPYIRMILLRAYAEGQSVTLQLDLQTPNGQMLPPITGKVAGLSDSDVVNVDGQNISIDMIRHIDLIPFPV